jgi:ADP-heptose:LPS heptosyltransferase
MKRCLLLCPIGIGNYILVYPTIYLLKKNFPETEFYLIALREQIGKLAIDDPIFTRVITFDPTRIGSAKKLGWLLKIRKLKCDTAISLFPSNRFEYNALLLASGAVDRYAFKYKNMTFKSAAYLANHLLPIESGIHDVVQNLRMLKLFGIKEREPVVFPKLNSPADSVFAERWLEQRQWAGEVLLGIHVGTSVEHGMIHKRWGTDKFAELAVKLSKEYNFKVLVFGGPEENEIKREITDRIGPNAASVENLTIKQDAVLIGKCQMFVSNNSSNMHIAAISGVFTVGIFGPTDETRTAPWGKGHLIIRKEEKGCPCWTIENVGEKKDCSFGDFRCLVNLTAKEVFEKILTWQKG